MLVLLLGVLPWLCALIFPRQLYQVLSESFGALDASYEREAAGPSAQAKSRFWSRVHHTDKQFVYNMKLQALLVETNHQYAVASPHLYVAACALV